VNFWEASVIAVGLSSMQIVIGYIVEVMKSKLSASCRHFLQCPLEEDVGGCTQRVQTAWFCLSLAVEVTWLALGGPFLSFFGINRVRNKHSPCRASISSI